ncbi:MAG: DUF3316 domain-containing protein [Muribaculaceae bacterium]|nr:DUF3316 domain-containing protein [Muribaculaceae bacterium]
MRINKAMALLALLIQPFLLWARASGLPEESTVRPVLSAYTVELGSAHIAETYLSPLRYSGWSVALAYERMQAMRFSPERWVMQLHGRIEADRTLNPARNSAIWNASLSMGWAMMRRFRLERNWDIFAGGATGVDLGAYYSQRNSNNPVAAKASWTIGLQLAVAKQLNLGKLPVCLRYQTDIPLTGIFFSPQYGELYYEIYLGNHKGLVRGAWPGNFFRMNNLLTADLRFGATTLRLGYRLGIHSSKASDIVTRHISHSAVVGICSEWISLSPRPRTDIPRIINSLY